MQWEIRFLKDAGFNMLRKHIKIESARYYAHCDRIGIIVWQDMVSGGISPKPIWFALPKVMPHLKDNHAYWRLGRNDWSKREEFRAEYQMMIMPSITLSRSPIWGPFNEAGANLMLLKLQSGRKNMIPPAWWIMPAAGLTRRR